MTGGAERLPGHLSAPCESSLARGVCRPLAHFLNWGLYGVSFESVFVEVRWKCKATSGPGAYGHRSRSRHHCHLPCVRGSLRSALSNVPRCGTARLTAAPVLHLKSPGLAAARSETRPWTELQKSPRAAACRFTRPTVSPVKPTALISLKSCLSPFSLRIMGLVPIREFFPNPRSHRFSSGSVVC